MSHLDDYRRGHIPHNGENARITSLVPNALVEDISEGDESLVKLLEEYYNFMHLSGQVSRLEVIRSSDAFRNTAELTTNIATSGGSGRDLTLDLSVFIETSNTEGKVVSATPNNPGYNYHLNDTITVTIGQHTADFRVAEVNSNPSELLQKLESSRDLDEMDEKFLDQIQAEIATEIPNAANIDKRSMYKLLSDFYKTRGSEESIQNFFRLFYGDNVTFSYPSHITFKPSVGDNTQTLSAGAVDANKEVTIKTGTRRYSFTGKIKPITSVASTDVFLKSGSDSPKVATPVKTIHSLFGKKGLDGVYIDQSPELFKIDTATLSGFTVHPEHINLKTKLSYSAENVPHRTTIDFERRGFYSRRRIVKTPTGDVNFGDITSTEADIQQHYFNRDITRQPSYYLWGTFRPFGTRGGKVKWFKAHDGFGDWTNTNNSPHATASNAFLQGVELSYNSSTDNWEYRAVEIRPGNNVKQIKGLINSSKSVETYIDLSLKERKFGERIAIPPELRGDMPPFVGEDYIWNNNALIPDGKGVTWKPFWGPVGISIDQPQLNSKYRYDSPNFISNTDPYIKILKIDDKWSIVNCRKKYDEIDTITVSGGATVEINSTRNDGSAVDSIFNFDGTYTKVSQYDSILWHGQTAGRGFAPGPEYWGSPTTFTHTVKNLPTWKDYTFNIDTSYLTKLNNRDSGTDYLSETGDPSYGEGDLGKFNGTYSFESTVEQSDDYYIHTYKNNSNFDLKFVQTSGSEAPTITTGLGDYYFSSGNSPINAEQSLTDVQEFNWPGGKNYNQSLHYSYITDTSVVLDSPGAELVISNFPIYEGYTNIDGYEFGSPSRSIGPAPGAFSISGVSEANRLKFFGPQSIINATWQPGYPVGEYIPSQFDIAGKPPNQLGTDIYINGYLDSSQYVNGRYILQNDLINNKYYYLKNAVVGDRDTTIEIKWTPADAPGVSSWRINDLTDQLQSPTAPAHTLGIFEVPDGEYADLLPPASGWTLNQSPGGVIPIISGGVFVFPAGNPILFGGDDKIVVSGFTGSSSYANGVYNWAGTRNDKPFWKLDTGVVDNTIEFTPGSGGFWQINDQDAPGTFASINVNTDLPPVSGWQLGGIFEGITPAGSPSITDPQGWKDNRRTNALFKKESGYLYKNPATYVAQPDRLYGTEAVEPFFSWVNGKWRYCEYADGLEAIKRRYPLKSQFISESTQQAILNSFKRDTTSRYVVVSGAGDSPANGIYLPVEYRDDGSQDFNNLAPATGSEVYRNGPYYLYQPFFRRWIIQTDDPNPLLNKSYYSNPVASDGDEIPETGWQTLDDGTAPAPSVLRVVSTSQSFYGDAGGRVWVWESPHFGTGNFPTPQADLRGTTDSPFANDASPGITQLVTGGPYGPFDVHPTPGNQTYANFIGDVSNYIHASPSYDQLISETHYRVTPFIRNENLYSEARDAIEFNRGSNLDPYRHKIGTIVEVLSSPGVSYNLSSWGKTEYESDTTGAGVRPAGINIYSGETLLTNDVYESIVLSDLPSKRFYRDSAQNLAPWTSRKSAGSINLDYTDITSNNSPAIIYFQDSASPSTAAYDELDTVNFSPVTRAGARVGALQLETLNYSPIGVSNKNQTTVLDSPVYDLTQQRYYIFDFSPHLTFPLAYDSPGVVHNAADLEYVITQAGIMNGTYIFDADSGANSPIYFKNDSPLKQIQITPAGTKLIHTIDSPNSGNIPSNSPHNSPNGTGNYFDSPTLAGNLLEFGSTINTKIKLTGVKTKAGMYLPIASRVDTKKAQSATTDRAHVATLFANKKATVVDTLLPVKNNVVSDAPLSEYNFARNDNYKKTQHLIMPQSAAGKRFGSATTIGQKQNFFVKALSEADVYYYDNCPTNASNTPTPTKIYAGGQHIFSSAYTNSSDTPSIGYIISTGNVMVSTVAYDSPTQEPKGASILTPLATNAFARNAGTLKIYDEELNSYSPGSSEVTTFDILDDTSNQSPRFTGVVAQHATKNLFIADIDDGSGEDQIASISRRNMADTYVYGNSIADYCIISPYVNTVQVSYQLFENSPDNGEYIYKVHTFDSPTSLNLPKGIQVYGTDSPNWIANNSPNYFANPALISHQSPGVTPKLWKFKGRRPFALIINNTNLEETQVGINTNEYNVAVSQEQNTIGKRTVRIRDISEAGVITDAGVYAPNETRVKEISFNPSTLSSFNKITDSNYYQDFSYEINTTKPIGSWAKQFERIIHTAGLKYFANVTS